MPMEPRLFVKVPRSHSTFCFEVLNTNPNRRTDTYGRTDKLVTPIPPHWLNKIIAWRQQGNPLSFFSRIYLEKRR